ncbi:hepatitis A virus cellular receptor 1 homolog [Rattus norvegicus]|uniref:Hepatitis A virus cellular receptor 1 like 1 n=2 Tax=Rattus norvegicus TaxID=10116 RepID=D4A5M6_RAT|nr:hepatitis A virus cellular receptor 1 homolog [Rattus norvegicus]|eukprot:XP_002727781.1 PREDICTED: hepatitis A virus cellular receptor 1 homolog [Rattus norvegicus]
MMPPQVLISGLLLLLPAAVDSFPEVHGVVGQPVTLPCTYPVSNELESVCWGRGECASDTCGQTLVWTDGNQIYQTSSRYQINAQLLQGNASLTIEDTYESDSGLYCCRVEMKGWDGVQTLTTSLQVQPVWTETVTSSDHPWNNHTEVVPTETPLKIPIRGLCIGISVSAFLLILASIPTVIQCRHRRKKSQESNSECGSVSFHVYHNEAFQSIAQLPAEDVVYVTEDSAHPRVKSQLPLEMTTFQTCRRK